MLEKKHIVVGVTGGIAAYKTCELVSRLTKRGAEVRVVMTEAAARFVSPLSFETLSGHPAYTDTFDRKYEIGHVALAKWADLILVAPATANCMGKYACGIADDLLSTTLCAARQPVLLAPAMNAGMWRSAAVQANFETLKARGTHFVGPEAGHLACGDDDIGRMSEPATIAAAAEAILCPRRDLEGLRVLVTAGPTVERIDPVRYITNRSTGKMGYAIAEAARDRGAEVTLVSGPVQLARPAGVAYVGVESCAEMHDAVLSGRGERGHRASRRRRPQTLRPSKFVSGKIKKTGEGMLLRLKNTADIARELGARKRAGQILVAFAAETDDVLANAREKLARKNADMVVANDVSRADAGFGADTNVVTLITAEDARPLEKMDKRAVADAILDRVLEMQTFMKRYASVVVDLSAGALDRVFSYRVPEDMEVSAGYQVLVPFGARQLSGFVVGLSDHADLPDERIRPLLGAMQPYPVILPELIELADWLHGRYLCNLVDALRLMIPSELRSGRVRELKRRYARLTLSDAQARGVYLRAWARQTADRGDCARCSAAAKCHRRSSTRRRFAALVRNGAVELRKVGLRRTPLGAARADRVRRSRADARTEACRTGGDGCDGRGRRAFSAQRRDRQRQDRGLHPHHSPRARSWARRPSCWCRKLR